MAIDLDIGEDDDGKLNGADIYTEGGVNRLGINIEMANPLQVDMWIVANNYDGDVPDTAHMYLNREELIWLRDILTQAIDEHKPAPE